MKYIELTKSKKAIVDNGSYDVLSAYKWCYHNGGYAVRGTYVDKKTGLLMMHRAILECPKGCFVDHINGDKLDNRLENLRIVTTAQNLMNSRARKGKSKYKGVSILENNGRYEAYICPSGSKIHLGCFLNEDDAATAYNKAAIKYFGEYALLNAVKKQDI